MSTVAIEIQGILIEIQRKPIKNLHLKIYPPDGDVRVSIPRHYSLEALQSFLEEKMPWIEKQRAHVQALKRPPTLEFGNGEIYHFLGKQYILEVIESAAFKIELCENFMKFYVPSGLTTLQKKSLLLKWYRQQMACLIPPLIAKWEIAMGVNVSEWGIKVMKTRWGSCNTWAKRIWLNLTLIQKSLSCLESVIVHELVHLIEPSHNKRFYHLMDKFMPDWRMHKQELKTILPLLF